jgi:hypothetical protein
MPFFANIFSCFAMEKGLKLAPFYTVPGISRPGISRNFTHPATSTGSHGMEMAPLKQQGPFDEMAQPGYI